MVSFFLWWYSYEFIHNLWISAPCFILNEMHWKNNFQKKIILYLTIDLSKNLFPQKDFDNIITEFWFDSPKIKYRQKLKWLLRLVRAISCSLSFPLIILLFRLALSLAQCHFLIIWYLRIVNLRTHSVVDSLVSFYCYLLLNFFIDDCFSIWN